MANPIREYLKRGEDNPIRAFLSQQPTQADPDVPIVDAQGNVAPMRGLLERAAAGEIQMEPPRGLLESIPDAKSGLLGQITGGLRDARDPSAIGTMLSRTGRGMVDNFMAIPSTILDLRNQKLGFPASGAPRPEVQDIQAVLGTAGQLPSPSEIPDVFREQQNRFQQQQTTEAEQNPIASAVGDFVADGATLAAMRLPKAKVADAARIAAERLATNTARTQAQAVSAKVSSPAMKQIDKWASNAMVQWMGRGSARAAEAGFEGALIAALNDDDPMTGAALAAGQQVGSSLGLALATGAAKHPEKTFIGGVVLFQMLKEMTPGGRDRILETFESVPLKMSASLGLGLVTGAAGGGRLQSDGFPLLADAVTAFPRGAVQSFVREFTDPDTPPESMQVIEMLAQNRDALGTTARRRIERAILNPDMSVKAELKLLSKDRQFRTRLDNALSAPDPRLIGVPVKEDE